jgi:hypothetical protein
MKKRNILIIAIVLVAILAGIFAASIISSTFREKVISTIFRSHKSLVKAEPDYIFEEADFYSTYEANEKQSDSLYIDRIIQVRGPVAEILQEEELKYTLILRANTAFGGVNCSMDEEFRDEIANLSIGDTVIIKGVCAGMLMDVILTRCVLVSKR